MDKLLVSHPQSYFKLIGNSLKLYASSFIKVLPLALMLGLTIFIPRFISFVVGSDIFQHVDVLDPRRLWLVAINLVSLMFFISILWRMHCVYHKKKEPFIEDITVGLKKVWVVFVATLIQSFILFTFFMIGMGAIYIIQHFGMANNMQQTNMLLVISVVFLFFILIYAATLLIFLPPIIAVENKGILSAIKRSVILVWNNWWRAVSIQFTPWVCYFLTMILVKYYLKVDVFIYFVTYHVPSLMVIILHMLLFMLYIAWVAALMVVQIHDLEIRKHLVNQ